MSASRSGRRSVVRWTAGWVACVIIVAVSGVGHSYPAVALTQTGHWIWGQTLGKIFHIDGDTKAVDQKLSGSRALDPADQTNVIVGQNGTNGYAVYPSGHLDVFSKSNLHVVRTLGAPAGETPVMLEGIGGPYLVYQKLGTIFRLGDMTTVNVGQNLHLSTPVLRTDGTLWVQRSGPGSQDAICQLAPSAKTLSCVAKVPTGQHGSLVTLDDRPAIVDTTSGNISEVTSHGLGRSIPGVPRGSNVKVSSTDALGRLPVVVQGKTNQDSQLVLLDTSTIRSANASTKSKTVDLPPGDYATPIAAGPTVVLVNRTSNTIYTYSNNGVRLHTVKAPTDSGNLRITRGTDGRVYIDNQLGTRSYVVDGDGTVTPVDVGASGSGRGAAGPTGPTKTKKTKKPSQPTTGVPPSKSPSKSPTTKAPKPPVTVPTDPTAPGPGSSSTSPSPTTSPTGAPTSPTPNPTKTSGAPGDGSGSGSGSKSPGGGNGSGNGNGNNAGSGNGNNGGSGNGNNGGSGNGNNGGSGNGNSGGSGNGNSGGSGNGNGSTGNGSTGGSGTGNGGNGGGGGQPTHTAPPAQVPDAPASVQVTPGLGTADVDYSTPAANGAALTGYEITYHLKVGCGDGSMSVSSHRHQVTIDGLKDGAQYVVQVAAQNKVGTGPKSAAKTFTTKSAPAAASIKAVANTDGTIGLTWQMPAGSTATVTGSDGKTVVTNSSATTGQADERDSEGTPNRYTLTATQPNGQKVTATSNSVVAWCWSDAVQNLDGQTAATGEKHLYWDAPDNLMGGEFVDYFITADGITRAGHFEQHFTNGGVATGHVDFWYDGLVPGQQYHFTVVAETKDPNGSGKVLQGQPATKDGWTGSSGTPHGNAANSTTGGGTGNGTTGGGTGNGTTGGGAGNGTTGGGATGTVGDAPPTITVTDRTADGVTLDVHRPGTGNNGVMAISVKGNTTTKFSSFDTDYTLTVPASQFDKFGHVRVTAGSAADGVGETTQVIALKDSGAGWTQSILAPQFGLFAAPSMGIAPRFPQSGR